MRPNRLLHVPRIGVDRVGDEADAARDPSILRLENMDTDLRPPEAALAATRRAIGEDAANSYLPFHGHDELRSAAAAHVTKLSGRTYDRAIITAGGCSGILNVLLATVDTGDEVILTDPVYVGLLNRVRLAGGEPKLVPLRAEPSGWRLDIPGFAARGIGQDARGADGEPFATVRVGSQSRRVGCGCGGLPVERRVADI